MKKFIGVGNETPEEIIELLKANADKIENGKYFKKATDVELRQANDEHLRASISLKSLEAKKEAWMIGHKAEVKPLALIQRENLELLTNKGHVTEGNLYTFVDRENETVGIYNEHGELVSTRMAYPDELQTNIFSIERDGTNTL